VSTILKNEEYSPRHGCIEVLNKVDGSMEFSAVLLDAIDEGLLVLGENSRTLIYQYIERKHQVKREEIPERLELFHETLISFFSTAEKILEKIIAGNLYGKLGLSFTEHEGWTLIDYLNGAKEDYRNQLKGREE
jgi:hypothetical protein